MSFAFRQPCRHLALSITASLAAGSFAQEPSASFDSRGLRRSEGVSVRLQHPAAWKRVAPDDELALAELRGPQGKLTAVLQIARGSRQADIASLCKPERARTMLQGIAGQEPGTRMTDVVARQVQGRPAYELRYERNNPPDFLLARSMIVCLKDSRLLVSCAGSSAHKHVLAEIEPVCKQVLESVTVSED